MTTEDKNGTPSVPRTKVNLRSVPCINVEDVAASLAYYRDCLGFEVDWRENSKDGKLFMAGVNRDCMELFIQAKCEGAEFGARLYIELGPTNKLTELYEEFRARGAKIFQPPTMEEWGWTVLGVTDLDGNILLFAGDEIDELKCGES